MPLFSSHKTAPPPEPTPPPKRTSGLFGSKRDTTKTAAAPAPEPEKKGLFSSRRSSSPSHTHTTTTTSTTSPSRTSTLASNLLHRNHEDASITAARQRVADAENAEKEADRALLAARASVKAAREEVRRLEAEAAEEARRARIKQQQAANISNRAKPLGRHGV